MSIVLTVYSKSAFKEFLLPAAQDMRLAIRLESRIFNTEEDAGVYLENIGGKWFFTGQGREKTYRLPACRAEHYDGRALLAGSRLSLHTRYGESLAAVFREIASPFVCYEKYDLSTIRRLTIGSSDACDIVYSFKSDGAEIVSTEHAVLEREGDDGHWRLHDLSTNGTFVNDMAILGTRQLMVGDKVNIWGLYMVYTGSILAISPDSGARITDRLQKAVLPGEAEAEDGHSVEKVSADTAAHTQILQTTTQRYYHRPPRNMERLASGNILLRKLPQGARIYEQPHLQGRNGADALVSDEVRRIRTAYERYLDEQDRSIGDSYRQNMRILCTRYRSALEVSDCTRGIPAGLWSRNVSHRDFLFHRLGKGRLPFQVDVEVPGDDEQFYADALDKRAYDIADKYRYMDNVPVCVNLLEENLIGIVGGNGRRGAYQIAYDLIAQIATQNSYTDVKLAFLTGGISDADDLWSFALWFPHVWSEDHRRRYIAFEQEEVSDVCYDLTTVFRNIIRDTSGNVHPHYIVIVEDQSLIEDELISGYLYDHDKAPFVTTLLMAEQVSDLPNACNVVIENDTHFRGMYRVREGRANGTEIDFDTIDTAALTELAGTISGLKIDDERQGGEIPDEVSFLDMNGAEDPENLCVEDNWRRNRTYEGIRAYIGCKSGGQPCVLDLHEKYHGPHGLIAGTTGSGKSELLQTWILSLAVNYSPEDVAFFLIDYKGGGMGNAFRDLPHVVGQISNLSGNLARRAMVSIKSENRRRQRLFAENGVSHIDAYTRLYKNGEVKTPIPHLMIIIDEFAQLKAEEPDFMRELISVAQIGRSLGVHLILATQKPSGTVDDNIWSNSKFRICLRVQDQKDSTEMLHKPDAAFLSHTGRAILQVGNDELYEEFQAGYTGKVYDTQARTHKPAARLLTNTGREGLIGNYIESRLRARLRHEFIMGLLEEAGNRDSEASYEDRLLLNFDRLRSQILEKDPELSADHDALADRIIERAETDNIRLPQRREQTELFAVVEYIRREAVRLGLRNMMKLWLPELPNSMTLDALEGLREHTYHKGMWPAHVRGSDISAYVGLLDDPVNQFQMPFILDFTSGGNTAVCGMSMSGRSTLMQTVLYSLTQCYSPEEVHIYAIDFGSRMLSVLAGDAHVGGVITETEMDRIPNLMYMLRAETSSRKSRYAGAGFEGACRIMDKPDPAIIFAIDDMASFREKTENAYDDALLQIARECAGVGIYLLMTGAGFSMRDIPGRMSDMVRTVICLQLPDRAAYMDALRCGSIDLMPQERIPGRGVIMASGRLLEFQTALATEGDDLYRIDTIREILKSETGNYSGRRAPAIPYIPEKPTWRDFAEVIQDNDAGFVPIGYNITSAQPESIELRETYLYVISGRPRSGKTNLIRILMRECQARAHQSVSVIETAVHRELEGEAAALGASYISGIDDFTAWLSEMIPVFRDRNAVRKSLRESGMADDAVYEEMMRRYDPCFIFIDNLTDFAVMLHSPEGIQHNLSGAMTNLFEKGSLLGIYFFAAYNDEERGRAAGLSVYETYISYKTGIHLGGMADAQSVLRFEGIPYRKLTASGKPGSGITAALPGRESQQVVVPLA